MLQVSFLILVSWALIWLFEKQNLSVLGLLPNANLFKQLTLLFVVSALMSASAFWLRMYFAKETYIISPDFGAKLFFTEIANQLRTVLTEELICRGALLYILVKRLGSSKAIVISSVLFAVLHLWMGGVWGNLMQMLIVFVFTFAMGLLLAFAYCRSFSLLLPFAIHFGWNLVQNYVFPESLVGNHVFVLAATPPTVTISYFSFFTMMLFPKVGVIAANYFIIRRQKQVDMP